MDRFVPRGFYFLLALADGPAQGYEIQDRIITDTMGDYLKHSSLYDELNRMERAGFIRSRAEWGSRRRFVLTLKGERLARARAKTLEKVLEVSRERGL
jgi:DNA-binding PadR family transcriptional regulator